VEGLPETVAVPARGKTALNLRFTAAPEGESRLAFAGSFNGKPCSPLYAPVWLAADRAKSFAFDRPERWRSATPGTLEISHAPQEQAVKFVAATPEACDAVAEYALHLPAESLRGAVGVAFEVRVSAVSPPNAYAPRLVAVRDDAREDAILYATPTTHWDSRFVYFPSDAPPYFDPARITVLKIGLVLPKEGGTFWVRHFRVIYK